MFLLILNFDFLNRFLKIFEDKIFRNQIDIEHVNGELKLILHKINKTNEGVYECRAENNYNFALYKCIVKVIGNLFYKYFIFL